LIEEGDILEAGTLKLGAIATPGHTPADLTFTVEDVLFTGDTLLMPDMGTGRCDFPGGDATAMYDSVANKLYRLPVETRVFVGHDYMPGDRELRYETTIGESMDSNYQLRGDTTEAEYVHMRESRDKILEAPRLLFQSVQVNVDAGRLPQASDNEIRYLRIPINVFRPTVVPENLSEETV
jgi:glyoxylase-like metal-dependent hydrolase (beta-lactamase superfamily II)